MSSDECAVVARIVIERHISENGQHLFSSALDEAGRPLDPITLAGMLEMAKINHLGGCGG